MRIAKIENLPKHPYRVLGIDPGLKACGICLLNGPAGTARFATVRPKVQGPSLPPRVEEVGRAAYAFCGVLTPDLLVVEHMQIYPQRKQKGDPNDLIDLAFLEGFLVRQLRHKSVELPTPEQWKKGLDKAVHHHRLRRQNPWLPRMSKDAMDAFGLAFYGLERLRCRSRTKT